MAAGDTRKADAIRAASRPSTVCSISGVRAAASMAGWAQTNISCRRWSRAASASVEIGRCGARSPARPAAATAAWRARVLQAVARGRSAARPPDCRARRVPGHVGKRPTQRIRQRVLGSRDVARPRRQDGDEPPIGGSGRALRGACRVASAPSGGPAIGGRTGRTSTDAVKRRGRPRRPVERRVEVGHLDDEIAAELFLGVGEGAVLDLAARRRARARSSRCADPAGRRPSR